MRDARYIQAVDHTLGREQRVRTPNLAQSDDADFMAGVLHGAAQPSTADSRPPVEGRN